MGVCFGSAEDYVPGWTRQFCLCYLQEVLKNARIIRNINSLLIEQAGKEYEDEAISAAACYVAYL